MVEVINGQDYKSINSMFDLYNIEYGENFKKTDLFHDAYKMVVDFVLKEIDYSIEKAVSNRACTVIEIYAKYTGITYSSRRNEAKELCISFNEYGYAACADWNKRKGIVWAIVSELFKNGQIQNWHQCKCKVAVHYDDEFSGDVDITLSYITPLNKYKEL